MRFSSESVAAFIAVLGILSIVAQVIVTEKIHLLSFCQYCLFKSVDSPGLWNGFILITFWNDTVPRRLPGLGNVEEGNKETLSPNASAPTSHTWAALSFPDEDKHAKTSRFHLKEGGEGQALH